MFDWYFYKTLWNTGFWKVLLVIRLTTVAISTGVNGQFHWSLRGVSHQVPILLHLKIWRRVPIRVVLSGSSTVGPWQLPLNAAPRIIAWVFVYLSYSSRSRMQHSLGTIRLRFVLPGTLYHRMKDRIAVTNQLTSSAVVNHTCSTQCTARPCSRSIFVWQTSIYLSSRDLPTKVAYMICSLALKPCAYHWPTSLVRMTPSPSSPHHESMVCR